MDAQDEREEAVSLRTKAGIEVSLADLCGVNPELQDVPHDGGAAGEVVVCAPSLRQDNLHNLVLSPPAPSGPAYRQSNKRRRNHGTDRRAQESW